MAPEAARVLTLGYEGKSIDQVLDELTEHDVSRVVDVRAIDESSVDGFSGDELAQALGGAGIGYEHLGTLGDFQPEPYPDYMTTDDWHAGYEALLDALDPDATTALLCICADVSSCHRRYLARRLREDGHTVVHLTPAGPKEAVTFDAGP